MLQSKNYQSIRKMVVMGMLAAVILVLMLTGIGILQINPVVGITFYCVPVLVGVMAEGLPVGMGLGLAFGLISFFQAFTSPTLLAPYMMNPLVSVLPRVLIPVVTWLTLRALSGFSKKGKGRLAASRGIAAFMGSLTNTVLVLGAIFIICKLGYVAQGIDITTIGAVLLGVVVTNGLPEAAMALVVTPAIMAALDRSIYKAKNA